MISDFYFLGKFLWITFVWHWLKKSSFLTSSRLVFNVIYSVQTNMNCIFHTFLGNEVMGREPHITGALQILIHKYDMDITQQIAQISKIYFKCSEVKCRSEGTMVICSRFWILSEQGLIPNSHWATLLKQGQSKLSANHLLRMSVERNNWDIL